MKKIKGFTNNKEILKIIFCLSHPSLSPLAIAKAFAACDQGEKRFPSLRRRKSAAFEDRREKGGDNLQA